nr:CarD family transcriptional regulator [Kaistia hirudinis]
MNFCAIEFLLITPISAGKAIFPSADVANVRTSRFAAGPCVSASAGCAEAMLRTDYRDPASGLASWDRNRKGVNTRMAAIKKTTQRSDFKTGERIVYPAHGVGEIVGLEEQEVAGIKLELFVIAFEKDKMKLRVPVAKANSVGMRKLSDTTIVKKALETIRGRARVKRTMWSRRAQEYEAKINSGDLIAISEVVRDLYRSESQPEQSYSERQLYEAALDRMSREIAAVSEISETEAIRQIEQNLAKSPRRGGKGDEENVAVETAEDDEHDEAA